MMPLRLVLALLVFTCALPFARAHSAGESNLTLSADAENFEVRVSLSLPSAASLLPADAAPLSSATLGAHRPALLAAASQVCVLVDSSGAEITPQRVLVTIFEEHEARFHFLFPVDARPALVRVPLLAALGNEAFCVVSDLRLQTPARAILTSAKAALPLAAAP